MFRVAVFCLLSVGCVEPKAAKDNNDGAWGEDTEDPADPFAADSDGGASTDGDVDESDDDDGDADGLGDDGFGADDDGGDSDGGDSDGGDVVRHRRREYASEAPGARRTPASCGEPTLYHDDP